MPQDPSIPQRDSDTDLDAAIEQLRTKFNIPKILIDRMVNQESGGNTSAVSLAGARGRFQVTPDTLATINRETGKKLDNNNPLDNAYAGLYLLRKNYDEFRKDAPSERGAWMRAVAAYHAGAGNVQKDLAAGGSGIPDVGDGLINTRDHVYNIFSGTKSEDFAVDESNVTPLTSANLQGGAATIFNRSTVPQRESASVDVKPAEFAGATPQEPIEGQAAPLVFKQGREQPTEQFGLLNPVRDVYEALDKKDELPEGIAGLQSRAYVPPDSHQLGERVTLPLSSHVTPSENDVVNAYLSTLGPAYQKAGEEYRVQTGHNILSLGGGALKQDEQGNYYVRPSKGAVDFLNAYMQHGPDAALVEANRQAGEYVAAQNKAFEDSKTDVAEARAATEKAKGSATTRGLLATSGLAQAAGTILPSDLGGREFLREATNLRAAQEQAQIEQPAESLSTANRIKMGIGGLIPTAAMLIATHKLGPAQLAAMGVLEGSTPEERLRGGLQGAAAQAVLGGAPAAFEAAGIPKTGMATTSAAMVAQPAIEAWQRGDSPVQAITENLPFAALPFFMHAKFGRVQEAADQSGVPKGRLRVMEADNPDATHIIIKPSTRRNMSAIPIREEASNAETVRSNQGQVGVEGRPNQASQNVSRENLQQQAETGSTTSNAQKQVTIPQRPAAEVASQPPSAQPHGADRSASTPEVINALVRLRDAEALPFSNTKAGLKQKAVRAAAIGEAQQQLADARARPVLEAQAQEQARFEARNAQIEAGRYSATPRFDQFVEDQTGQRMDQVDDSQLARLGQDYKQRYADATAPSIIRDLPPLNGGPTPSPKVRQLAMEATVGGPPLRETVAHATAIKSAVDAGDGPTLNRLLDEAGITDADLTSTAAKGQFNATTEATQTTTNRESQTPANVGTVPARDSTVAGGNTVNTIAELPNGQFQVIVDTPDGKVRQTFNTREQALAATERSQLPSTVPSRGTFQAGLDPTKAFTADDLATIRDKAKTVSSFLSPLREALRINKLKPVEVKFGKDAAADVVFAMHGHEAGSTRFEAQQSAIYDNNFGEIEKWFDRLPSSQRDAFNYQRGEASTSEGQALQESSLASLRNTLRDPKLIQVVKEASDWAYNDAVAHGFTDLNYFKDYFRGQFKDPTAADAFMDHWFSTEGFTKEKQWPTIADAAAHGLTLKNNNPITNIKSEVVAVNRRASLQGLRDQVLPEGKPDAPFITEPSTTAERAQLAAAGWRTIDDPVFSGAMADPTYARLVNTLLETNKFTPSNPILWSLRQATRLGQTLKFMGSIYHLLTITKAAVADETVGMVDPRGYGKIINSVTQSDRGNPQYVDYINNGGGHRFSLESDTERLVTGSLNRIGNVFGVPKLGELGQFIPGSPANIHWQFETYIPEMKFQKYSAEVADKQAALGRELTRAEKQTIIKRNQEIYGEMNERLYGRSGTVTTALRLPFTAPGFAEGNIRQIARIAKGDPRSIAFMVKSLAASAAVASLGTRILSGQWPPVPQSRDDVRDLFKINTGQTDAHGNAVYLDTLTYDKDFWTVYGNLATLRPGKIPGAARARLGGMESPLMRDFTTLATWIQTGAIIDWKGDAIVKKEDPYSRQISEGSKELGRELLPIPGSTYQQFREKGFGRPASVGMALMGTRPTTSESIKNAQEQYYEEKRAREIAPKSTSVPPRAPRATVPQRP